MNLHTMRMGSDPRHSGIISIIRDSMAETAIGIDVAKNTFVAATADANIQTFPNTAAGVREFCRWARPTRNTIIGMEATGVYHTGIGLTLLSYGYQPVVINPLTVKRYAGLSLRKTKTDKTDAMVIRQVTATGAGYPLMDTPDTVALRALVTERSGLVATKQALKGRMHAHTVRQKAAGTLLPDVLTPTLACIQRHIRSLETQMAQYAPETQRLLRTIPGIGPVTAATLVAIVGDMSRFAHRDQFVAFVGIDPRVYESGTAVHGRRYITKRGNATLRHILYQAAFIACRHDPVFARYYAKKKQEGKHHVAIVCALERKLCARIFAVWRRGTPFVPAE